MDAAEQDIYNGKYTLFSKVLYGGIASGVVVIPTNAIKIILAIIFPPLGTILEIIGNELLNEFPYITWNTLTKLFDYENFNKIIYTFILTSMFYVPGLVYTLAQITTSQNNNRGTMECNADTGECVDTSKK
jgi:uncharacterized membrane protein YqaE (UPF0057 family)